MPIKRMKNTQWAAFKQVTRALVQCRTTYQFITLILWVSLIAAGRDISVVSYSMI
jgi:hypothetical protein